MTRTVREFELHTDIPSARDRMLQWLEENGFEVLELDSTGKPIEKSFKSFRVVLTTHPGSVVALSASRMGMIVFEIKLVPMDSNCVVHGEFYVAGASGGVVNFQGKEFDVCKKPDWVGRLPRKKGFRLMGKFISAMGGQAI